MITMFNWKPSSEPFSGDYLQMLHKKMSRQKQKAIFQFFVSVNQIRLPFSLTFLDFFFIYFKALKLSIDSSNEVRFCNQDIRILLSNIHQYLIPCCHHLLLLNTPLSSPTSMLYLVVSDKRNERKRNVPSTMCFSLSKRLY